jgi:hypothetical protein
MRTIRVDEPESEHPWLWLAAGAAIGLTAGVLISRRMGGKRAGTASLAGRGRRLAGLAMKQWGPLLETAMSLKEAWDDRRAPEDEPEDDGLEAELDEEELDEAEAAETGIDERVLEAFSHDPILAVRAVEIEEEEPGCIVLHGRVRSAKEAKHALTIARGVPGVERVRQRLTIPERSR